MSKLTTHVLDTTHGKPACGMRIVLSNSSGTLKDLSTDSDGRCGVALLEGNETLPGSYELLFYVRDYFESLQTPCPFLDIVPIRFEIEEGQSYHVPLLCSPWSYSTYRGS